MSNSVKFRFNVAEGSLELEGPEDFVTRTLEDMKPFLTKAAEAQKATGSNPASNPPLASHDAPPPPNPPTDSQDGQPTNSGTPPQNVNGIATYPHTFSEVEGQLHIVAQVPGDSKKQKMTNMSLLYCLGSELLGQNPSASEAIRNACLEHGCLDSPNFTKIFKDKQTFIAQGDRKKTVRLTHAGRLSAKQLAESIEENANN